MDAAEKPDSHYTYADYCSWPDDERWELIGGEAYAMSAPSLGHQAVSIALSNQLYSFLRGKPCKAFTAPCDVRLNPGAGDDTVVQPDIIVVCDESKLEDGKSVAGAPDLIIEILSPATAGYDMVQKYRLYQHSGVREYWIADPEKKLLMVNVLRDGKYTGSMYFEDDDAVPVSVLDGCSINLSEAFEA